MQMSIPIAMLTADSLGPPSLPNCDHVPVNLLVLSKKKMGMGEWDDYCYCGKFPKIPYVLHKSVKWYDPQIKHPWVKQMRDEHTKRIIFLWNSQGQLRL